MEASAMKEPAMDAHDPARDVVTTRWLHASRARAFEAFRDPAQLVQWWGPDGFTTEVHAFDLRPGGRWRLTMRGPDGAAYPMEKTFVEVVEPALVVLRHEQEGHSFTLAMAYADEAESTRLTWRMRFDTPEQLAAVKAFVVPANEQNLARLAAHLARPASAAP